jgi:hypothetical protein
MWGAVINITAPRDSRVVAKNTERAVTVAPEPQAPKPTRMSTGCTADCLRKRYTAAMARPAAATTAKRGACLCTVTRTIAGGCVPARAAHARVLRRHRTRDSNSFDRATKKIRERRDGKTSARAGRAGTCFPRLTRLFIFIVLTNFQTHVLPGTIFLGVPQKNKSVYRTAHSYWYVRFTY